MDSLSTLLQDLDLSADVFFSGRLCGLQAFDEEEGSVLHFVKTGAITLQSDQGHDVKLNQSSVIFIPEGMKHRLMVRERDNAELVCATIRFPAHQRAVLIEQLPKILCIDFEIEPELGTTARRIFDEAFNKRHGRQIMIDRLCDLFIVQLLRYVIENGIIEPASFSGRAHPRLSPLINAMQTSPEQEWSVHKMADLAAMSRSGFAALFKETTGLAPMEYLTELRLLAAKARLKQNKAVSIVANEVGYDSASSLARIFRKRFGVTPKQWIKNQSVIEEPGR